jgi:eukaryotic-like serine/threonine-protein kinase
MIPTEPQPSGQSYVPIPTNQIFPRWERLVRIGSMAVGLAVLLGGYRFARRREPDAVVSKVDFSSVSQWTADPGLSLAPAFSHDQKLVAYASDRGGDGSLAIWLKSFPSGEPRRLTNEAFDASDPDFSPDDTQIVYRSQRDGGGIYIMPISGATPRLIARQGMRPRFSPDGKWIAYYELTGASSGGSRILIVTPEGGQPKQIRADFPYARYPVWSPNGRYLLFEGHDADGWRDWWVTPLDGGPATPTRALQIMNRFPAVHAPERWVDGKVLFSATEQQNAHLWTISISPTDWQASGQPRQLTNGDGIEQVGSISAGGRLIFTRMRVAEDVWSLPVDANRGVATGSLKQVTDDQGINQTPTVTADGSKLAYVSDKTGMRDIWVRDPKTGVEEAITAFSDVGVRPVLSVDGNRLAYPITRNGKCEVLVTDLKRSSQASTLNGCANIWGWSHDGSDMIVYTPAASVRSADILKPGSGERRPLLAHSSVSFFDADFSPDGRWITFTAGLSAASAQIYVAPFRGAAIHESEWIPITREGGGFSAWSPDGSVLYFQSSRDGYPCIWSQKLDGGKRPVGAAVAVLHLHSASFGMHLMKPDDFHMSVAKNRVVLNLVKETANLWVTGKLN